MSNARKPLAAGDQIHFLAAGLTFQATPGLVAPAHSSRRGETITVTVDLIAASRDRNAASFLELVDDESAQVARWGMRMFARGAAPDDLTRWTPNSPDHDLARDQALKEAWALPTAQGRMEALAQANATYGRKITSRTMSVHNRDWESE